MTSKSTHRQQALLSFPFFGLGLVALLALVAWAAIQPGLFSQPLVAPAVLAFVHLAVLGWLGPFVFGAAFQLIPVLAEAPLWSRRLAWIHFVLHAVAAPLLIAALARADFAAAGIWGSVIAVGGLIFTLDLIVTADQRTRWSPENVGLILALFWFAVTIVVGATLAFARAGRIAGIGIDPLRHLHLVCGLVGFFAGTLYAVSFKLVPMFLIGRAGSRFRQWSVLVLLHGGLFLLGPGLLGDHRPLRLLGAFAIAAATGAFVDEILGFYRGRFRPADAPLLTYFAGIAMLIPTTIVGVAALLRLDWWWLPPQPGQSVFVLLILGVLTPCILGMAGKIVPFLAWQWCYSAHIGRHRVPLVTDLFRAPLLRLQLAAILPALAALVFGVWFDSSLALRGAALGLLVAAATLALNIAGLLPHLLRPRLLPPATAPQLKP